MTEFKVDVAADGGVRWVVVQGELDIATAPEVAQVDLGVGSAPRAEAVVVDLSACHFLDSSGARALVELGGRCTAEELTYTLVSPPEAPSRFTLELLGVTDAFPVHPDTASAADELGLGGGA